MVKSGIYKIINIVNNKIYVGSSVNIKERKKRHFIKLKSNKHENRYLQNAFNKYGEENFIFEIIEYVENKNMLLEREQYWIDELSVCDRNIGYNMRLKAGSNLGYICSEETREKLRQISLYLGLKPPSCKGIKLSEEHKNKISNSHKGKKMSKEAVFKSAEARKGYITPMEVKQKISKALKGKTPWNKNKKMSEDAIKNMSECKMGHFVSEETKQKMSKNNKNKAKVLNITTKKIFTSITEASKYYNIQKSGISAACRGLYKMSGGFEWTYYNQESEGESLI